MFEPRKFIKSLGSLRIPQGAAWLDEDPYSEQRQKILDLESDDWKIYFGYVQYALPSFGWHRVALAGGRGIVNASGGGRSDDWGTHQDDRLKIGSSVLVAVHSITSDAIILGQLPNLRQDPDQQFELPSFLGSHADASRDPMAAAYVKAEEAGGAFVVEDNSPGDIQPGDHYVRSSTGVQFSLNTLDASMATDDVTGVWFNLVSQTTELSGRQMLIDADGLKLHSELNRANRFQLGGSLQLNEDPELVDSASAEDPSKSDADFYFDFEHKPYEVFSYNVYAAGTGLLTHLGGARLTTSESQGVDFGGDTLSSFAPLRILDYPPQGAQESDRWYPLQTDDEARLEVSQRLKNWTEAKDLHHFSQPLFAFTEATTEWVKGEDQFVYLEPSEAGEDAALSEAVPIYECSTVGRDLDPSFVGEVIEGPGKASWIRRQPDGSIFIGNEYGAGIRLVGDSVFIEGANIRMASLKDITLLGRDVNLQANRDVNLTAKTFLRAFSDKNVSVLGGASGSGGVLIESRSTTKQGSLPEDSQEAIYSGVAIKASRSQVSLLGGDVLASAGAIGSGRLVLRSESQDVVIKAANQLVTHSNRLLNTFGGTLEQPAQSSTQDGFTLVLEGQIHATDAFFKGGVSAGSNIQSFFGRMGDSVGGQLGKVQNTSAFTTAQQSLQQRNSDAKQAWAEAGSELKQTLEGQGRPLNQQYRRDLSVGFKNQSSAEAFYGAKNLQPTTSHVFTQGLGLPQEPRESLRVDYRPDGNSQPTYPWPGDTSALQLNVPISVTPLQTRIRKALTEDPEELEVQPRSFASIFATLGESE